MRLLFCLGLFISCFSANLYAQSAGYECFFTQNGNLYIPVNNPNKGVYPILWYDKTTRPRFLIGGLGVGALFVRPLTANVSWRTQTNLSKHTYWDELTRVVDVRGLDMGYAGAGSSDYTIGLTSTLHYNVTGRVSVGTGIGGQLLLISLARLPDFKEHHRPDLQEHDQIAINKHYKPIVPVLPVELAVKLPKGFLFTTRYEHGLLNRIKGDLSKVKTDKYGLLTFELGVKI
ncbi:hypothetical protein GCM10023189_30240 [Nibrella saemangeumensis]|uniref:Outer membrane protein beta-barrel domain-containing protein n=1 Tax=Nibrella saemangeumensis TaxID=1084526 RepID=A0ABP8N090_9BACT